MNILLSSGGRRPYLTRWFQQALAENDIKGRVIVADLDPLAPAQGEADAFFQAPRVSDAQYAPWLQQLIRSESVDLAISINDFELSVWSGLREEHEAFAPLLTLSSLQQAMAEDKMQMDAGLAEGQILAPRTLIASDPRSTHLDGELVVKGRFGSGSRGLSFTSSHGLTDAIAQAGKEVTDAAGRRPDNPNDARNLVVVQPRVIGQEFGLDVVNDLQGDFVTVLARRKLAMRGGETDKAVTVDPSPFIELGRALAQVTQHRGLIDVDVIRDENGLNHVIDVNPRFGGGYPFSHVGGAHIPAAYVAWVLGRATKPEWLASQPGVAASKFIDVALVGTIS